MSLEAIALIDERIARPGIACDRAGRAAGGRSHCGQAGRFDVFARLKHAPFPGGRWLRMPSLVLGMAYYRLRDWL